MLRAMAETIQEKGDGSDLVLRASRAAVDAHPQAAWACAGVTDEGLAVLVHGNAAATVRVDDGSQVTLTAGDSMLPQSRVFAGASVTAILVIGGADAPDDRFWLGNGVVQGGGLAVTASFDRVPGSAGSAGASSPADAGGNEHPPTLDRPVVGGPGPTRPAVQGTQRADAEVVDEHAVLVDGTLCENGHFTDPTAWACRFCGAGLLVPPEYVERRPRPPLGQLVFDDGMRVPLDADYVLGREPTLDGEVLAGRMRPLLINDPDGTVSRLHLKITLVGWQVEVSDLGSANGSFIQESGDEHPLVPFEPAVIEPGAQIRIGHRSMQYVSYQGARQ
jgi:hypothetical protein